MVDIYIAKTRIKKIKKEKIESSNTHDRKYWIKEFESHGFEYVKKELTDFTINEFLKQMFEIKNKKSNKFKIGRKVYQNGGYIGKRIAYLIHKISNLDYDRNYGEFLFIKE